MVLQYVCIFNLPEMKHSCVYYTVQTAVNFYFGSALILYVTKPERLKDPLTNPHVSRAAVLLKSDKKNPTFYKVCDYYDVHKVTHPCLALSASLRGFWQSLYQFFERFPQLCLTD